MPIELTGRLDEESLEQIFAILTDQDIACSLFVSDGVSEKILYFSIGGIRREPVDAEPGRGRRPVADHRHRVARPPAGLGGGQALQAAARIEPGGAAAADREKRRVGQLDVAGRSGLALGHGATIPPAVR